MSQRIKIRNPFDPDKNFCFGCGPANPAGLKLTFEEDDEKLYATWNPSAYFQGYSNVLHGGIMATLLDETGAWCIYVKAGTSGVTSSMTVKYLKPVYISKGAVSIEASVVSIEGNNARLFCRLFDGDGNHCAEAELEYFIYPEEVARKRYSYPGREAFYNVPN
jgi:uncharacterized protein (TIGR00369 family)